jgi:hypothetical protein
VKTSTKRGSTPWSAKEAETTRKQRMEKKQRSTPGGSPSRSFSFPCNGRRSFPRTVNPALVLLPFTLDVSSGAVEDLGDESPTHLGFERNPRQPLIGGSR